MPDLRRWPITIATCLLLAACTKAPPTRDTSAAGPDTKSTAVQLTLDWKPEPEFGGFYAASLDNAFTNQNLNVTIKPAGEGADTWQLVATGKTEFATSTADQVLIARDRGADVIAIFTVYQTFPQGIMVHKARGFTNIQDVFTHDGVLLAENGNWLSYLQNKFGTPKVKITGYDGGIASFLAKPDLSQQCFITSEPILAKHQGSDPLTFLIADEGFNPYTTVVICQGEMWKNNPAEVKAMAAACRAGWRDYLDNPAPTNKAMHDLNSDMDPQTFADAAEAQKPLIETDATKSAGLGSMTPDRWNTLAGQLKALGTLDHLPNVQDCFVNP
jgi:NitT/TauT family transport system substrate-binding protein